MQLDSRETRIQLLTLPLILILNGDMTIDSWIGKIIIPESSNDKMWGLFTYDTVFTVFTTLLVFALGIFVDRLIKHLDRIRQQKELRLYFKHFLDIITDRTCPQLASMYEEVYKTSGINEGIKSTPPKVLTGDLTRIRSIQDKHLFRAFKNKAPYSEIISHLDFLELVIFEVDSFHNRVRSKSDELKKPLQNDVNKYFDVLGKYLEHVRLSNPQYPGLAEFRDLVNNSILMYHQEPRMKRKFTEVYIRIIRPIQRQVVQSNIFRADPIGYEIAELGKQISIQFHYVRIVTIEFRLEYRKFSRYIKETQAALSTARQKIRWE